MALSTGKTAEVMFEKWKETYDHQDSMLSLVTKNEPTGGMMQNASNVIWYPVQQHRPVISGWDISGQETGIIEETYPAVLGTPNNDFVQQRADDLRTQVYWERAAAQSAKRQATELNKDLAQAIVTQGSLFYTSNATSGYDFIGEAQAIMNERQLNETSRCFILNDRDNLTFASDLAARQTLQGRPESIWASGQLAQNVAGFDNVMVGSFLPNIVGDADGAMTVGAADQSFTPSGGTVNATTKVVTNVDYREASLLVDDSSKVIVGDKVTIADVYSTGLADKNSTGQLMTFSVIEITDATHIKIYPKPIAPASADAALTTLQGSYSNIDSQIQGSASVDRLNTDTNDVKTNIFFDKSAIEVIGGTIPAELFAQYDGMKVITDSLSNGLQLYMVYDGDIATMNFRFRIFVWYGITVCNPSNCGVATTF